MGWAGGAAHACCAGGTLWHRHCLHTSRLTAAASKTVAGRLLAAGGVLLLLLQVLC